VYTSPCSECTAMPSQLRSGLDAFSVTLGTAYFLHDPDTRFILRLISGSGTTLCAMHLAMHLLFLLPGALTVSRLLLIASTPL
jgi:hypothetical protein